MMDGNGSMVLVRTIMDEMMVSSVFSSSPLSLIHVTLNLIL